MYDGCNYYENMCFIDFDRNMDYPDFYQKYWGGFLDFSLDKLFTIVWTGASSTGRTTENDPHAFRVIVNTNKTVELMGEKREKQAKYIDQIFITRDYVVGETNDYKRIAKLISSKSLPQFDMINDYFEYIVEDEIVHLNSKIKNKH